MKLKQRHQPDNDLSAQSIFERFNQQRGAALVAAVSTLGLVNASHAAGPAVSELNAKVEGAGGVLDSDGTGVLGGSVAAPLGERFGVQLDGIGGKTSGDGLVGYGAHVFWRDPDTGLAGLTASRLGRSGDFVNRVGAEGELYHGQWTFGANAGSQTGFLDSTWYAGIKAQYYVTDDLLVEAGGQGFSDQRFGTIGVEWQPSIQLNGLTLFATGGIGSDDADYALAGVKFYFGAGDKSLQRRHREDDPVNPLIGTAANLNQAIVDENRRRDRLSSSNTNNGSSGGSGGGI